MPLLIFILGVIGISVWMHEWWPVIALAVVLGLFMVCCMADDITDQR